MKGIMSYYQRCLLQSLSQALQHDVSAQHHHHHHHGSATPCVFEHQARREGMAPRPFHNFQDVHLLSLMASLTVSAQPKTIPAAGESSSLCCASTDHRADLSDMVRCMHTGC